MHAPRFQAAVATLAACLLVQACSDSEDTEAAKETPQAGSELPPPGLPAPPPAPRLPSINACSLLNAQEVGDIIGHDMDGPEAGPTAGGGVGEGKMNSCSFASRSESENAAPAELLAELNTTWFVNVTVWVWPSGGQGARNYMNAMRDAPMTDDPVREVDGLADEAVWNGTLHARQGDVTVSLDVRPPQATEAPKEPDKERTLMEQALGRL